MTGVAKPAPIEVFEDNMEGALRLIALTHALLNTRKYAMRRERREALGIALKLPKKDWNKLDWAESPDVFVILKPSGQFSREQFTEPALRPLLRQAIVAVAAAVESYVAEKASSYISGALKAPPDRLRELALSLGDVIDIEEKYKRRRWGYRDVIERYVQAEASSNSAKVGIVFATVGRTKIWGPVDSKRGVAKGVSEKQLDELAKRRNRIAHTGDRIGRKHATLDVAEVELHFENARSIVEALESTLPSP